MATFKCKMCGGSLEVTEGKTVCTCEYCHISKYNLYCDVYRG